MNIVVFGCDNSGKTTLAKTLDSILGGYVHSPGPLPTVDLQKKFIEENLDKNMINIFDRFPIFEEKVCGTVLRNKNLFEGEDEYIKNTLSRVDLFIYCNPGIISVSNWGDREQMDGIKDNVNDLMEGYNSIYNYLKDNNYTIVEYNYNVNGKYIMYEEVDN